MKKIIPLLVILLAGCQPGADQGTPAEGSEKEPLLAAKTTRISTAVSKGELVRRVLMNLDTIEFSRKVIMEKTSGAKIPEEEKISTVNEEIARLNKIIARNKKEIALLNEVLKDVEETELLLNDTIMMLTEQLAETAAALEMMKHFYANTEEAYRVVESELFVMSVINYTQYKKIERLTDSISRVYYAVQPKDYLVKHGVIQKGNGVLSFIGPKELNPNVRNTEFTRADRRKILSIPLGKTKSQVITTHPDNSYSLVTDENKEKRLVILNPTDFWSVSRYLVVATK